MRNSSSLIHIKLDKTSFFYGLSLSKTNRVHIFLFYFLSKSFPILLLVFILISRFNFILVWFNLDFFFMINFRRTLNRGKTKKFRTPYEIHNSFRKGPGAKFRTPCKSISHTLRINFAHPAKISRPCEIISNTLWNFCRSCEKFRTPNTISHTVRNPKGCANQFHTPKAISHTVRNSRVVVRKWKDTLFSFLNPEP